MTEDIVERVARAIEQRTIELQGEGKLVVHGYNDSVAFAQAALAAIRETHAIVPRDETLAGASDAQLRREVYYRKFLEKVEVGAEGDCWHWVGSVDKRDGYGRFYPGNGTTEAAHRYSFLHHNGEIAEGAVIDHTCRNRNCVNPEHLRATTNADNVLVGSGITAENARKTHCKNGHELIGDNVYVTPQGWRNCRACHREKIREHRARKKAAMIAAAEGEG